MYIVLRDTVFLHLGGAKIEITTDGKSIVCGQKLTLVCKVEDYASTSMVTWRYDNDVIPIAECVKQACSINPKYVGKYEFTYDLYEGFFNLTNINLSRNDIERKYICSNGYERASKIISLGGKDF